MPSEHDDATSSNGIPLWRRPDWSGPRVELRSEATDGHTWPEGAVERVVFTREEFSTYPYPHILPYTQYFSADGWPLTCPEDLKPKLDLRMRAEFHKMIWTSDNTDRRSWYVVARNYEEFKSRQAELGLGARAVRFLAKHSDLG